MCNYEIRTTKILNIWERDCQVEILFDCYEGEEIDSVQESAYEEFIQNFDEYTLAGKSKIEQEIEKNYASFMDEKKVSNIFRYAVPKMIYISKDPEQKKVIGLICHFKFDLENGIAVKYVDGKITDIGGEQIVL